MSNGLLHSAMAPVRTLRGLYHTIKQTYPGPWPSPHVALLGSYGSTCDRELEGCLVRLLVH